MRRGPFRQRLGLRGHEHGGQINPKKGRASVLEWPLADRHARFNRRIGRIRVCRGHVERVAVLLRAGHAQEAPIGCGAHGLSIDGRRAFAVRPSARARGVDGGSFAMASFHPDGHSIGTDCALDAEVQMEVSTSVQWKRFRTDISIKVIDSRHRHKPIKRKTRWSDPSQRPILNCHSREEIRRKGPRIAVFSHNFAGNSSHFALINGVKSD
jgi:hypothetical protein